MARRKSAAEVGPLGVWAYDTRDLLDLSVEEVIAALPTTMHPATLRKVEGGSARPGTRMWRELGNLYASLATEKGIDLEPQPRLAPEPVAATVSPDSILAVVTLLLEEIRAERQARVEWERGLLDALRELAGSGAQRAGPEPAPHAAARP